MYKVKHFKGKESTIGSITYNSKDEAIAAAKATAKRLGGYCTVVPA